jgi:hypothetical protein
MLQKKMKYALNSGAHQSMASREPDQRTELAWSRMSREEQRLMIYGYGREKLWICDDVHRLRLLCIHGNIPARWSEV